ncbi:MAG: hypothetical protein HYV46_15345, partial [candidate division NC10 bacterium]|nr:hypothetical protein [candidate division NC10 bacterium]
GREYTSGGIALLLDLGGDDAYWGEAIAQGVGYWFALGLLIDADGNDFYHARHYSQGCAFHFAVGGLLDNGGNDAYLGSVTCQGSGYDYSAGVLVDYGGDDLYRSDHLSSGSGGVTGMGVLVDLSGSDHYLTGRPGSLSLGGGQFQERRGFGCIGVFLDLGGGDRYAFAPAANQALWTRPEDGVGLDTDSAPSPFTRRMTVPGWPQPPASASLQPQPGDTAQPAAAPEQEVQAALDLLANPYGPAEKRAAAAELIKKYPDLAEPRLIRFLLAEPFYLSFQAAYEAIPKVGVPMIPSLVQVYRTGDAEDRMRALNMLGRIDDPRSVETVLAGLPVLPMKPDKRAVDIPYAAMNPFASLDRFCRDRGQSLRRIHQLSPDQLACRAVHAELGEITLGNLLAEWVIHDLSHIRQLVVAAAPAFLPATGPWRSAYPHLELRPPA